MPTDPHFTFDESRLRALRGTPRPGAQVPHRPGLPRTPLATHRFESIESLQRALVRPQFEVQQVHKGRFDTSLLVAAPRPNVSITLGTNSAGVRSRGLLAADATDVVVVVDAPGVGYFNGIPLRAGTVLVMPPGIEFEGHSPSGFAWVNLHLRAEDLLRTTRALTGRGFDLPTREILARSVLPADGAGLRALHAAAFGPAGALASAADVPSAESVAETWLGIVARSLGRGAPDGMAGVRRSGDRHRIFLAAEAFMRRRVAEPVYMAELCAETGVSERTLEYVFRERMGITPIAFLASLRLNGTRLALVDAGSDPDASVAEIARRFGFVHLGRFASQYRAQFGEPPSATLRRPTMAKVGRPGPTSAEPPGSASP